MNDKKNQAVGNVLNINDLWKVHPKFMPVLT